MAEKGSSSFVRDAVIWNRLDRITGEDLTADAAAQHASMTLSIMCASILHWFFTDSWLTVPLTLKINGDAIEAWDPFLENHPATYRRPRNVYSLR